MISAASGLSTNKGVFTFRPTARGVSDERLFTHRPGVRIEFVFDALPLADHSLWAVLLDGMSRLYPDAPQAGTHLEPVSSSIGLADLPLEAMALDRNHNLWIGSDGGGVSRIARNGFVSFSETDGLGSHDIVSVFENTHGQLFAVSRSHDALFLNLFSDGKFRAIRINVPSDSVSMRWHGHYQVIARGAGKDWWVATRRGLLRFTGVKDAAELGRTRPLPSRRDENIFRLFEDRSGRLWISDQHYPENVLTIWNRQTGTFDRFPASSGGPDLAGIVSRPFPKIAPAPCGWGSSMAACGVVRQRDSNTSVSPEAYLADLLTGFIPIVQGGSGSDRATLVSAGLTIPRANIRFSYAIPFARVFRATRFSASRKIWPDESICAPAAVWTGLSPRLGT